MRTLRTPVGVASLSSQYRDYADQDNRVQKRLAAETSGGPSDEAESNLASPDWAPLPMFTIPEAAGSLSVGRSTVYAMLKTGELDSVTIGRLRRIPIDSLEGFLSSLQVVPSGAVGTE